MSNLATNLLNPCACHWMRRIALNGGLVLVIVMAVIACGGKESSVDDSQDNGPILLNPEIVTRDLAIGPNSFAVGLIAQEQELVIGADVQARFFYVIDEDKKVLRGEGPLEAVNIGLSFVHIHDDGSTHNHQGGAMSVYKAAVTFDEAGIWVVEITAVIDGEMADPASSHFEVREETLSPVIGSPAPRSHQRIISDVEDITEIDSSNPPNHNMHNMTIADAVTSGRPTVIVFSTPAFCISRVCGPTKQLIDSLYYSHGDRVNFVHVEPYFLEQARSGVGLCSVPIVNLEFADNPSNIDCPRFLAEKLPPANETWNLFTEPWTFIVDSDGNIIAKFEGVMARIEIEAALEQVLIET